MSLPRETPRVGIGWDRHRLEAGRPCVLGGVTIPGTVGPVGHSDADAVLHALTDALLGAAGLDDLGTLFPDHDARWKDASSMAFLREALGLLRQRALAPASVDLVVVCDAPRIGPHRQEIRAHLAGELGLPTDRVNLKGKSTEGAGGGWIECTAVALLAPAGDLPPRSS